MHTSFVKVLISFLKWSHINSYVEYFYTLANEHKEINDFYMMDINEPLAAQRSNIKYPVLILTSLFGNFEASNLDNILDSSNGGFLIIGHWIRSITFPLKCFKDEADGNRYHCKDAA